MVKKTLLSMAIAAAVVSLAGCNVSTTDKYDNKIINEGVQYGPTSSVYPIFAPEAGQVPLAIDFLFADAGASDGTANTAPDSENPVITALNKLDGFSTVAPLYIEFSEAIDANTVEAGKTVFLAKLNPKGGEALVVDETNPFNTSSPITPAAYEARAITLDDGRTPAIQILLKKPLEPKTKYLVVLTDGIKGANGETIGQSTTYAHAIGSDEIVNDDLAPVRSALQGWQDLANGFLAGVIQSKEKSVFNYTFTTGGTDDVLKAMAAPGTFLESSVKQQITSIAVGEGAIKQATIAKELADGKTQPQAEAIAEGTLDFIAGEVATQINAGGGSLPTDGATVRPILKSSESLQPYYLAGLQNAATIGKQEDVAAEVDMPTSRAYKAIINPDDGKALPVPYDDLLESQVAPKVAEQITSIAVGEGAIKQATIAKELADGKTQPQAEAIAEGTLDSIAGEVATQINAGGGSLPIDGAIVRPILKSTEELQPHYLAGLRAAITKSQVDDLSSKGSIYQGGLSIPNYLPASEAGTADGELGTWVASDDAAKALGLPAAPRDCDGIPDKEGKLCSKVDPNKSNVTYRFPFANKLDDITIPVMATLPNATECPKPPAGYPVVIYQHGITVDRTAGVLVGNALATYPVCTAMVAIDHTMHGVAPGNATGLTFNVETVSVDSPATKSPFAAVRAGTLAQNPDNWMKDLHERHNNVGKNAAQQNVAMAFKAAGEEADVGASGDLYINLNNFARTRDAMRQTVLDLMNLNASIGAMDIDGSGDLVVNPDGTITEPDLDPSKVYFIGHSLGAIIGTTFVAVNNDPDVQAFNGNLPKIQGAILGNGGGGVVKLLENSPSIGGAKILPGLQAAAGLEQGSADIEKFFGVMQAMVDSADPINFASSEGLQNTPVLMYTAVGDLVVPNNATNESVVVATAKSYLAGTDPLAKLLDLETVDADSVDSVPSFVEGDRLNVRIDENKGDHSTFSNAQPTETFKEIYTQIGSFLLGAPAPLNKGPFEGIVVSDKTVLEQVE